MDVRYQHCRVQYGCKPTDIVGSLRYMSMSMGSTLNGPPCTIGVLVLNAPNAVELLNLELRSSHSLIYHGK